MGYIWGESQYSRKWYVPSRRVYDESDENGLPHIGSEWYASRVNENLLHGNGHHVVSRGQTLFSRRGVIACNISAPHFFTRD